MYVKFPAITGNWIVDQTIANTKSMHPNYEFSHILDGSRCRIDITKEWWNSYNGSLFIIFENNEHEVVETLISCKHEWKHTPPTRKQVIDVLYDMETQDPDDLFALAILASHPEVNLRSVCLTPGSELQVGILTKALERLERTDVRIGAFDTSHPKDCVSSWWTNFLGEPKHFMAIEGVYLYHDEIRTCPDLTIVTGGPLKNLGRLLREFDGVRIARWVAQGGFAGDGVVPAQHRLAKFAGRETCPTFNFNGDPRSALAALSYDNFGCRMLVSKNVCHGLVYDRDMHDRLAPYKDRNAGLQLIYEGMDNYLRKHSSGMFHDPLAVCAAINPNIITFKEVEMFRVKGEWGSRLCDDTGTFISIIANHDEFFETMIGEQ